ncbi:MAG: hypothetical protein ACUVV6_00770 [Thermoplasmatota archaeon]
MKGPAYPVLPIQHDISYSMRLVPLASALTILVLLALPFAPAQAPILPDLTLSIEPTLQALSSS